MPGVIARADVARERASVNSGTAKKISPLAVAGWVSYDLGNTVFSFNIVSIYLPLWVVNDMGGRDSDYGLANSITWG